MTLPGTVLERGRVLPGVSLVAGGGAWTPWSLRGCSAQVLAFLHAACDACDAWAVDLAGAELHGARAFAILDRPAVSALPVLVDPGGAARATLLGDRGEVPTVLVADRYAAAWEAYPAPGHDLPAAEEIAATIRHAEISCTDCAAPGWGR